MPEKPLLRLLSCGSVDDGKSTLIGRILHDCGTLYEDQLALLEKERTPEGLPDFSALLDGLLAEREQAITIDLAWRSFRAGGCRYLVADAPGHEQYTRNMVTGASRADAALLLIDAVRAQNGLLPQTLRHSHICALMGVPHLIAAVNKMDCRAYDQRAFTLLEQEFRHRIRGLDFASVTCVPVSALKGDNVCRPSAAMSWYQGPALLDLLENLEIRQNCGGPLRLPVQYVARAQNFRGLCGTIASGSIRAGQKVALSPSGLTATVKGLSAAGRERPSAKGHKALALWFTGLSASGKSTLAELCAGALHGQGKHVFILDGDNLRYGLNQDLGFSEADRAENIRRAASVAKLMTEAGLIVMACFISPYRRDRDAARALFPPGEFLEIFVDTPLSVCAKRDPKGLYAKAMDGEIPNFTGLSAPFETPQNPDLRLDGTLPPEDLAALVLEFLEGRL